MWSGGNALATGGDRLNRQSLPVIDNGEAAIEALMNLDLRARVAASLRARKELQMVRAERDGVVGRDGAAVLEAEDCIRIHVGGPGTKSGLRVRRGLREARVEADQKVRQEGIRRGEIAECGQAHLGDEAILQSLEEALHAPFGLRRGGGDPGDAEFLEDAPDLCRRGYAAKLLLEIRRALAIALENSVSIGVDGDGESVGECHRTQEQQVALGILAVPENGTENPSGRVIDGHEQDEVGATGLKPGVVAPVELDEQAGLRHAFTTRPMTWGPTSTRAA